jgi:hypothetical protein
MTDFVLIDFEQAIDALGLAPHPDALAVLVDKYTGDPTAPAYNYALGTLDAMRLVAAGCQPPACARCGKELLRSPGKYGPFWGCSGYPGCQHIHDDIDGRPA